MNCSEDNEKVDLPPFEMTATKDIPGNFASDVWGFTQSGREYAVIGDISMPNSNFSIIDVTDPASPQIVSTIPYLAFDMKVWKNYLYIVDGANAEFGEDEGVIYDISNPASPQLVGDFPTCHNFFIDDQGYLYLSGRNEMIDNEVKEFGISIYDLNNEPTEPELVWTSEVTHTHDIAVIGNRMFDFHRGMGTLIFDVTNRSSPKLLGTAKTDINYDHSGWTTEDGNYLFITNEFGKSSIYDFTQNGAPDITIWNISDVSKPLKIGEIHDDNSRVHNFYIKGDLAFISYYSAGLKVYDISDPENPKPFYIYDTNGATGADSEDGWNGAFGVFPFSNSGNIFVSDINSDLVIFKPNR